MLDQILSEKDLERVFYNKDHKKPKKYIRPILNILVFILLCLLFYFILNAKSFYLRTKFWYNTTYSNAPSQNIELAKVFETKNIDPKKAASLVPQIDNNSISIYTISANAPIVWNVKNTTSDVSSGLQKGVIHLTGTALPGQVGNVFITGHSSNYPWAKGNFSNVFSLLGKLVVGDLIQIRYEDKDFIYKVSGSKVVKSDDLSVLKQGNSSILSLMTCTPIGTSINRLIIASKQIYPDPSLNAIYGRNNDTITDLPAAK